MMKATAMLLLVAWLASEACAGTITVTATTTTAQDMALAEAVARHNETLAVDARLTAEQWLADRLTEMLAALTSTRRSAVFSRDVPQRFETAKPEDKAAVCRALGLAGKLPDCP